MSEKEKNVSWRTTTTFWHFSSCQDHFWQSVFLLGIVNRGRTFPLFGCRLIFRTSEEGAALRSSSRRFLFGPLWDASCDRVGCAHILLSMCRRPAMERACLKSFIILSIATILSAYSSGRHAGSPAIKYCMDMTNMLAPI